MASKQRIAIIGAGGFGCEVFHFLDKTPGLYKFVIMIGILNYLIFMGFCLWGGLHRPSPRGPSPLTEFKLIKESDLKRYWV